VGDRAPDSELHDRAGTPVRLFDLYRGPHFTAVAVGPGAARVLGQLVWPTSGAQLRRVTIDRPDDDGAVQLNDTVGTFRKHYGVTEDALLLIRPDGYLASIVTHQMLATTTAAVTTLTPPIQNPARQLPR
jgi:hypothetical protein